MLYEIISPDAFLRPFMDPYTTLSSIYAVVRNAYTKKVYADRGFQRKTNELIQQRIGAIFSAESLSSQVRLDPRAIETIKQQHSGKGTKVINLIKVIQKSAEDNSDDPFLIAMAERAKVVQDTFEDRQASTEETLAALLQAIERDEQRKREQAARGLDTLTFFVLTILREKNIDHSERMSKKIGDAFAEYANWRTSENELRELRKQVTFAILNQEDDFGKVTEIVDELFVALETHG